MNFISLVLFVAQVEVAKSIATFYERKLSGHVNNIGISLVVDCMFASTTNSGLPKMPYFFLQVQNNQCGDSHERNVAPPEGQMLAAMILARSGEPSEINQDNKSIYGSWIQGAIWRFTTLNGVEYCTSKTYDATQPDDLLQIVFILRKLKELILKR